MIAAGLATYALLQAIFFPMIYSPADEGCYVGMAFLFAQGRISGEGAPLNLYRFERIGGRLVGSHDAGMSLLMAPLTVFGDRALFAFNMLAHAAGFVIFALLLRRLRIWSGFALLFLLYPTLWYFSRNILNDFPSAVLALAGVYAFLVGGAGVFASGLLWGLSLVVRPATAIFLAPAGAAWLIVAIAGRRRDDLAEEFRRPLRKALLVAAGMLPMLVGLLIYNVTVLESPSGLTETRLWRFLPSMLPGNLLRYLVWLNVVYPLMLIVFFLYRGPLRWPMTASLLCGWAFFLFYPQTGEIEGYGLLEGLVLGPRRLAPVLPFLMLGYASFLQRLRERFGRKVPALFLLAMVLVLAGDAAVNVRHQQQQKRTAALRDALFDATPRGALVILDYPARRFISGCVTRPRELVVPFLDPQDSGITRDDLDNMIRARGEAWAAELHPGGSFEASAAAQAKMDELVRTHPRQIVADLTRDGWRLIVYRLDPKE